MWQVDNRTPFAAERSWVRDRNGAEIWLVAVKCTFDIQADGTTEIAKAQPPVLMVPEWNGEPGKSSLKYEADLVRTKVTTDCTVLGHAYAPGARPVTELDVGFRVGPITKAIKVMGDRIWSGSGPSAPEPFEKMPLVYERAFGGVDTKSQHPERDWDWRNPVGSGFAVEKTNLDGSSLPNLELRDQRMQSWSDRPAPAGFGPIASHWQPRVSFAGTYDDRWMQERQPLLPDDFDDRFYQCAPADQQAPQFLRGGEPVVLYRLTPEGELRFDLPRVFLRFETRFYTGERQVHEAPKLHSVILEPDCPRVSLVWHSALPCHFKVQKLERTIVTMKPVVRVGLDETDDDLAEAE